MLLFQKKTFKELVASEEGVATNLLSARLKLLESLEVITKRKLPENKKENVYLLSEKGIDLAPIIMEIALWSDKYVRAYNANMNDYKRESTNKLLAIERVQNEYRDFVHQILA